MIDDRGVSRLALVAALAAAGCVAVVVAPDEPIGGGGQIESATTRLCTRMPDAHARRAANDIDAAELKLSESGEDAARSQLYATSTTGKWLFVPLIGQRTSMREIISDCRAAIVTRHPP